MVHLLPDLPPIQSVSDSSIHQSDCRPEYRMLSERIHDADPRHDHPRRAMKIARPRRAGMRDLGRSALAAVFSSAVWIRDKGRSSKLEGSWHALVGILTAVSTSIQVSWLRNTPAPSSTPQVIRIRVPSLKMLARRLPRCSLRPTPRFLTTSRSLRAEDPLHAHPGSSGGHHGDHYDPPGGWLWGLRPGEKYEKEGWEGLFYYGFYGSFVVAAIAYAFKPDTT